MKNEKAIVSTRWVTIYDCRDVSVISTKFAERALAALNQARVEHYDTFTTDDGAMIPNRRGLVNDDPSGQDWKAQRYVAVQSDDESADFEAFEASLRRHGAEYQVAFDPAGSGEFDLASGKWIREP